MDIINIRKYMKSWAEYTYEEGINFCRDYSSEEKEKAKRILDLQNLIEKKMNGNSVERIPYKYEGALNDVSFSMAFYDALEKGYLTPSSYLMNVLHSCVLLNKSEGIIPGIVGRGLRSFPAFLREMDLAFKLQGQLKGSECFRGNVDDDIRDHTDVYLNYNGETYRIWSYQNSSSRALYNTVSKIQGYRGELPQGVFILCPFDIGDYTQYEDIEGWKLYSMDYIKKVGNMIIRGERLDYSLLKHQHFNIVKEYVREMNIFVKS